MNKQKTNGFTLVELIVVITILAILGTISFIALQGYSANSRDSVRISDLRTITSSLQLYQVNSGTLPNTNSGTIITYSGGLVAWIQGTFGEDQKVQTDSLDRIPKDPLTDKEYTYSVTNTKNEFELGTALESKLAQNNQIMGQTYADSKIDGTARISGNYNGILLNIKDPNSDIRYLVAIPTIINGDITWTTIENIIANKTLVTNGSKTLPASYSGSNFDTSKTNNDYVPSGNILVYTGTLNTLVTNESKRIDLIKNIKSAYSGTTISSESIISAILNSNTITPNDDTKNLANSILKNYLGIKSKKINNSDGENNEDNNTPVDPYTLPTDLTTMFANGSAWTENWTSNSCDTNTMSVVELSPGTDVIPTNLVANTIYKLSAGNYISSHTINMANCSGIVGNGTVNMYLNQDIAWGAFISNSGKVNTIISGVNLDGYDNGTGVNNSSRIYYGLYMGGANNNTIINSNIIKATYGMYVISSSNNTLTNLSMHNSGSTGMEINSSSNYNTFKNIAVYDNNSSGIYIAGSSNNSFTDITTYNHTTRPGIDFDNGSNNTFTNITSYNNTYGLSIWRLTNSTLKNIKTYSNSNCGVSFALSTNNKILNVTTYNNKAYGGFKFVSSSNYNSVSNINSYNNEGYGIGLEGGWEGVHYNTLTNVNSYNNSGEGLLVWGNNNLIMEGNFYNNAGYGISSGYSQNNIFVSINNYKNVWGLQDQNWGFYNTIYYSGFNIFGNTNNNTIGTFTGGSLSNTKIDTLGLSIGVVGSTDSEASLPSDYFVGNSPATAYSVPSGWANINNWYTSPSIGGWDITKKGRQCISSGGCSNNNLTSDFDGSETYAHGIYIIPQVKPVMWNTGTSKFEYFGTSGVEYDTTKHIGQW